ncbi:unnamed protein product [Adineta ricciae]|uniref:Uncharacterized protein n=1 Tax=Adineta ricciae TaxID=249248 RepID=A0A815BVA8_ADIRI|nr:unnamed protein product [Adineta ricciae]
MKTKVYLDIIIDSFKHLDLLKYSLCEQQNNRIEFNSIQYETNLSKECVLATYFCYSIDVQRSSMRQNINRLRYEDNP